VRFQGILANSRYWPLENDKRVLSEAVFPYEPRDQRIGYAGNNDLAAYLTAHTLTDAKAWCAVLAEQSEAFGVFHQGSPLNLTCAGLSTLLH
jgi:hypothetical protein